MGSRVQQVLLTVTLAAVLLPAAAGAGRAAVCTSPAGPAACAVSSGTPLVTPAQAKAAITAVWNAREKANLLRDGPTLDELDTGSMALEDNYALDSLVCKCSTWYWTAGLRHLADLTVYVPRQDHYPLYFLASIGATIPGGGYGATASQLVVATRTSPSTPWRLALQLWDTGYELASSSFITPELDSEGYDVAQPASVASVTKTWPKLLAEYYSHIKTTGTAPTSSQFLPGYLTTGTDLAKRRQDYVKDGVRTHYAFTADPLGGPWTFEGAGDQAFTCGEVVETAASTLTNPKRVFLQIDKPGQSWGPDLDTGYYSKIVTTFDWPVCILQAGDSLGVVGPTSGSSPIHTGGVPAKLSPDMSAVQ
jgi:hypothetical protein